jgi:hypothetical protein
VKLLQFAASFRKRQELLSQTVILAHSIFALSAFGTGRSLRFPTTTFVLFSSNWFIFG